MGYVLFHMDSLETQKLKPLPLVQNPEQVERVENLVWATMEDTPMEYEETNKDTEVAPALIAVHPTQNSVAVAVGSDLRVFDLL